MPKRETQQEKGPSSGSVLTPSPAGSMSSTTQALRWRRIEKAIEGAGYGVDRTEEVERTPFWRTPRVISVFGSALLFALGLTLGLLGALEEARAGAYAIAIVVRRMTIFRAALAGIRTRHLDMNVLMSTATVAAVGML
jgi:cation transport ATPase